MADIGTITPIPEFCLQPLSQRTYEMKRFIFPALVTVAVFLTAVTVRADNATMHGSELKRDGTVIRMTEFDVTLDGRLLTAKEGVYHPDTGIVELSGNVQLHFGANARTFPGEVQ
jgi:hypothetical protein